jgi:multiple sugar transport system permease protein
MAAGLAKKSLATRKRRDTLIAYSFIAPNFIGFAVFTLVPLVFSLALSFMEWDGANAMGFVGLSNFTRMFTEGNDGNVFRHAVTNTFLYTLGVMPVTLAAALGLAILLNRKIFARGFFRTVAFFPYVASLVAVAAVWNFLFHPTQGPINGVLHQLLNLPYEQLPRWGIDKDLAIFYAVLFSVWKNTGYYMVIYLAGLQNVNPELYEAAGLDGAGPWGKFIHVTIPQLAFTTFFVMIMLVINAFKVFDVFVMLFGGGTNTLSDNTRVLVYEIYDTAFKSLRYGYASAMAMVLFIIVVGITLFQFRLEKKLG